MKQLLGICIFCFTMIVQPAFSQEEAAKRNAAIEVFKSRLVNKPMNNFKLTGLDKQVWDLQKLKGKIVVMNFWFTQCGPCIKEMPFLNELVAENREKAVVFIAPAPENENQVNKFLKKNNFSYQIIPSSLDYITSLKIENFPTHLIIDKEGIIRKVFIGYSDDIKEKLQEEINKLVK